jgi:CRISPR-associated exonuclease Cas4
MTAGIAAHEKAGQQERRRTLAAYGLKEGERFLDVGVESRSLGLRGRIDLVIETEGKDGLELIPVEYKQTSRRPGPHYRLQLAAYGIMLEETREGVVRRGFIYSLVSRKAEQVSLTERLRGDVRMTTAAMREMVEREVMPEPPRSRRGCVNCEFRRFCNDVL